MGDGGKDHLSVRSSTHAYENIVQGFGSTTPSTQLSATDTGRKIDRNLRSGRASPPRSDDRTNRQ
jgi:hypothetical protein